MPERPHAVHTPPLKPRSTALGCWYRARGWLMFVSAAAIGFLGWYVMGLLNEALAKSPEHAEDIAPFARWMIANRSLTPLLAIPPFLLGLWLALAPSQRMAFWAVWIFAILWEVALFTAVFIAFIQFLVPLYQYQPL